MIPLNVPGFWYERRPTLSAALLMPLSWIWMAAGALRRAFTAPYTAPMPVICVGNVMIGGTGKTPAAIAILHAMGASKPCFLTRGYRGATHNATLIINADAQAHGDEAVLLAAHAPVIVAANRVEGLKLARSQGFDLVIADDGFQNPTFTKTFSVIVFDGEVGIGNGAVVPAGPMRETLHSALPRADAAIIVGQDVTNLRQEFFSIPVFGASFEATQKPSGAYVAFAGIGRPQKFFDTLKHFGYAVAEVVSFPDHHAYTSDDVARLQALAQRHNARLITTEKDHVRLPADAASRITTLPVTLAIEDMAGLIRILKGS